MTRYLKSVYAAVARISGTSLVGRQNQGPATEGDEGTGCKVAGSGAISARYLCLQPEDARSPMASRSGAQGRLRPEHRKWRGRSAAPARGNCYGEQRNVRGRGRPAKEPVSVRELWVSAGPLRRRHVYAAEMPAYQALSTDDFR